MRLRSLVPALATLCATASLALALPAGAAKATTTMQLEVQPKGSATWSSGSVTTPHYADNIRWNITTNLTTLHSAVSTACSTCHADGKGPFAGAPRQAAIGCSFSISEPNMASATDRS